MPCPNRWFRITAAWLACAGIAAGAQAQDFDPLALQSAPAGEHPAGETPLRLFIEGGLGRISSRLPGAERDGQRLSVDLRYTGRLDDAWRFSLSDRLDHVSPSLGDQPKTVNSLREAYLSWQPQGGSSSVELGRINLRQGPAYGYNPTDYFRTGGLRTVTTADPITLRQIRQGAVMLRADHLWASGGATVALAPRLSSGREDRWFSFDHAATNPRHRGMLALNGKLNERFSGQASVLLEEGRGATIGLSGTGLLGESFVAHAEVASVERPSLLSEIIGAAAPARRIEQAAAGLSYSLASTTLTVEFEHNGAGLDRNGWQTVMGGGPAAYQRYSTLTQPSQELGSRTAWLVYASHKGLGLKQLDLAAFVRTNAEDDSRLTWAELRYHWPRVDGVLQWQRASGKAGTEFGVMPYRQLVQILAVFYL